MSPMLLKKKTHSQTEISRSDATQAANCSAFGEKLAGLQLAITRKTRPAKLA
jgi:hypothetical protein